MAQKVLRPKGANVPFVEQVSFSQTGGVLVKAVFDASAEAKKTRPAEASAA